MKPAKHPGAKGRWSLTGGGGASAPQGPVLLTVSDLTVTLPYPAGPDRVLDGVSFEVARGSTTALIGANGAGKTTLLRTIAGMVAPSQGSIRFQDRELIGLPSHRICDLGIGQVPEGRHLFPTLTVRENLEIGAALPRARAGRHQRLDGILALFPRLAERIDFDAGDLTTGEQQMVAIGRCLMGRPELILFDEPTRGLAPSFARQLFQLIGTLEAEGITIILAEQNVAAALRLADAAHILDAGRIVRSGPGLELLEDGRQAE
jgi:branched-chain amino acid transport system ATP-binding protein